MIFNKNVRKYFKIMEEEIIDTLCDVREIVMRFFRDYSKYSLTENRILLNQELRSYSRIIDRQYMEFSYSVKKICCYHNLCQIIDNNLCFQFK